VIYLFTVFSLLTSPLQLNFLKQSKRRQPILRMVSTKENAKEKKKKQKEEKEDEEEEEDE
jgi:hypothetical protein